MSTSNKMDEDSKKYEHVKLKTEECRKLFGFSETETVIQDYACVLKGSLVGGRMYICQNNIGFLQKLPYKLEKIAFRKVVDIKETSSLLHKYITLDLGDNEKYSFGSFWTSQHYNEAFCLIKYLWHNPPSYIKVIENIEASPVEDNAKPEPSQNLNEFGGKMFGSSWDDDSTSQSSRHSVKSPNRTSQQYGNNGHSGQVQTTVQVDTQATKQGIKLLLEAQDYGANTLKNLSEQAEIIDKIEFQVESIHNNLDKGDRLLRGIESLPAYIGNSLSKKKQEQLVQKIEDRKLVIQRGKAPTMDIEILCKLPNDDFTEAIIALDEDKWICIDPKTNNPLKPEYVYKYTDIEKIVMRSRPEHCDIRFKQTVGKDRFRLMSSYLQILTNEFLLRTPKINQASAIQIIFETGSTKFDFNNPKISIQPILYTRKTPASNGFFRKENQEKTSALLQNASEETKKQMDEVDADLDEISGLLSNLGNIADTTGREISRQNDQLQNITVRMDSANERIHGANRRMDKIND